MRHLKSGRKLKRTSSHRHSLLNNLAAALFEHKKVTTTEAKAKELRPFAESLITKAKHALQKEKQNMLPEGQTIDIHNRRIVARSITRKAVLQELFDTIAPMVEERPGGYTRIIKLGTRRGDAGKQAIIELVDWSAPQDGAVNKKSKRKAKPGVPDKKQAKKQKKVKAEEIEETPIITSDVLEETALIEEVAEPETYTTEAEQAMPETQEAAVVDEEVPETTEQIATAEQPEVEIPDTPVAEQAPEIADSEPESEEPKPDEEKEV